MFINLSYRRRGKVPRTQTNRNAVAENQVTPQSLMLPPKYKREKSIDIKRMLVYSASMIRANPPLAYSVLYPETSSDSPSAKSKGVRFVSAKHEANQIIARKGKTKMK